MSPSTHPGRALTRVFTLALGAALTLGGCAALGPAAAATSSPSSAQADDQSVTTVPWSQADVLADPAGYQGASTAYLPQDDIVPVAQEPQPDLPATVTDYQATKVMVTSADRILALDLYGTLAATVQGLGLGGNLVGRDQSTNFPAARDLPLVTSGAHVLNPEAILALKPTVIITDTTLGPWNAVLQLRSSGIPVVVVTPERTLDNIGELTSQVAAALGVPEAGRALTGQLQDQVQAARDQVDSVAPAAGQRLRMVFLYVRGQAGVYYILGQGSGADSLIESLDGVDVATEAGLQGYTPLSAEALAQAEPDVILMMTAGLESVGGVSGALDLAGVAQTPAGEHRRIVDMSDYQVLSFGPLSAAVIDAMARAIYAPSSVQVDGSQG